MIYIKKGKVEEEEEEDGMSIEIKKLGEKEV